MKTWDNQKWHDHLNSNWMKERFETVSTRGGLQCLYVRLLENKVILHYSSEKSSVPYSYKDLVFQELSETTSQSNHFVSEFIHEPSSLGLPLIPPGSRKDVEAQIQALLDSQTRLARNFCQESSFMSVLRKRLIVLHRIFHAYIVKFNIRDKTWNKVGFQCHSTLSSNECIS